MNIGILNSSWDPVSVSAKNAFLNNPTVTELENKVIDYVKNSWCSEDKARLILELVISTQPSVCVEIGAFTGSATVPMLAGLQYLNHGEAYIIDSWSSQEAIKGLPMEDPNTAWWAQLDMKSVKNQFMYSMRSWDFKKYFQLLEMSSEQAFSQLPAINFIHIDGNFSEEGSLLDSKLYLSKVVAGGYILLSNALVMIGGKATKMKALWPLFEECDIVYEIENGNALLFRKK